MEADTGSSRLCAPRSGDVPGLTIAYMLFGLAVMAWLALRAVSRTNETPQDTLSAHRRAVDGGAVHPVAQLSLVCPRRRAVHRPWRRRTCLGHDARGDPALQAGDAARQRSGLENHRHASLCRRCRDAPAGPALRSSRAFATQIRFGVGGDLNHATWSHRRRRVCRHSLPRRGRAHRGRRPRGAGPGRRRSHCRRQRLARCDRRSRPGGRRPGGSGASARLWLRLCRGRCSRSRGHGDRVLPRWRRQRRAGVSRRHRFARSRAERPTSSWARACAATRARQHDAAADRCGARGRSAHAARLGRALHGHVAVPRDARRRSAAASA